MPQIRAIALYIFLVLLLLSMWVPGAVAAPPVAGPMGDRLAVSGLVINPQGKAVKDVQVGFRVNGREFKPGGEDGEVITGQTGAFVTEILLPGGTLPGASVEVTAHKPSWRDLPPTPVQVVPAGADALGIQRFQAIQTFTLHRRITPAFWIATAILLLVYLVTAFEWMHRIQAALSGAALMLFITYTLGTFNPDYFILSFGDAVAAIDMNVIFLLLGMMLIVGVTKKTGMFQWLAYKAYALARGNIFVLAVILMWITVMVSAFMNNVTTMMLMIPVTIEIAVALKINPLSLLVPEVFASNVGGTATLIGDPPNILIGSYARLTFGDFVINLTLICIIAMVAATIYLLAWNRKEYRQAEVKEVERTISFLRDEYRITNRKLLCICLAILGFTTFLFVVQGVLHMQLCIAALTGAVLLLAVSGADIVELLEQEVEWPTLIFFMALFMVVAGAEETGLIQFMAEWVGEVSRGNLTVAVIMVLWVSAIASAFVDNIPFAVTMLPIVAFLNQTIPGAANGVLWWALALGACLGGNGTMIGASANLITVGMAEKAGYQISFMGYMKACFIPMVLTVIIAMIYLLFAY